MKLTLARQSARAQRFSMHESYSGGGARSAAAVLCLLLSACGGGTDFQGEAGKNSKSGDANGNGANGGPNTADTGEGDDSASNGNDLGTGGPVLGLTWYWQCDVAPGGAPVAPSPDELVLEGIGPHKIDAGRFNTTPVTFEGKLCEPEQVPRDVIFVIDTSGSMEGNDPRVGNSCGRLNAMTSVLSTLSAGVAHIGLVTFNSSLDRYSSGMFDSGAALLNNLAGVGNVADVICNANGGTNYQDPLGKAQELLSMGRPNATKEIYFISDGEPNTGRGGEALAASLKANGVLVGGKTIPVTIATVMVAGNDQVMEQSIASRDAQGKALHVFVAQISELASALTSLTDNSIVGGELKYRPIGTTNYTSFNIMDYLDTGFRFRLPSFTIDSKSAPRGLEVSYEYYDKHDNRHTSGGKLLWKAAGGS